MTRIKLLIPIILLSLCATEISYAQNTIASESMRARDLDRMQSAGQLNNNKLSNAVGSPFIKESFELVKLDKFGDRLYQARYNANLGEMQIKRENDTIALSNSEDMTITFTSDSKTYKTYNYINKEGISKQGFLVVLKETESLTLLQEEIVKFYEKKPAVSSYAKEKPAEYKRANDVYYYKQDNKVSLLPQKRKDFLKSFPAHSDKLKTYIKKNRISLKDHEDLITLFEYINTL